ncbi:hypothetical protein NVP1031O_195 [Vibrio phage 1.031.O._10N.261.46.F8]|nr:hypothetical protein NVP1031O_195 [Vibrio phage 1.031.O._10N.261.46.F8]
MAYASYEKESFIVDALNTVAKKQQGVDTEVRFELSGHTRKSLADTKKSIIDFAKVEEMKGGKQILRVFLIKNFAQGGQVDIKSALAKMSRQLRAELSDLPVGTRYSWTKGKALDSTELTANMANKWADTDGSSMPSNSAMSDAFATAGKGSTRDLSKLLALGDEGDKSVLANNQMAARFIQYLDTADTVVLPRAAWRQIGFSDAAIKKGIRVAAPESGSSIIGIWRSDFDTIANTLGWTVTENPDDIAMMEKPTKAYQGSKRNASTVYTETVAGNKKAFESQVEGDPELQMAERMSDQSKYDAETKRLQTLADKAEAEFEVMKNSDGRNPTGAFVAGMNDAYAAKDKLAGHLSITPADHKKVADAKRKVYLDGWKQADETARERLAARPDQALDLAMGDRREKVQSSVSAMSQKKILLKKHPTENYFIVKSIGGQAIPTY